MGYIEEQIKKAKDWATEKLHQADAWMRENVGGDVYIGTENRPIGYEDNPAYSASYPSVAITKNGEFTSGTSAKNTTPGEINTASIDNFVPNTANGRNNMTENKSWLERNTGIDPTKALETVATIGANLYNQNQTNQFNAEEARKQRKFEERMSNTAYQRQANDMALAGVNPVASADMGGASTPSGSQASGTTPFYADPLTIANTALTEAQVSNVKADTELKGKQSGKTETEQKAIEIDTEIKKAKAPLEMALMNAQTEEQKTQARKNLAEYNQRVKELDKMDAEIALLKEQGKYTKAQRKMTQRLTKGIQTREWINTTANAIGQVGGVATKAAAIGQNAIGAFAM